MKKILDLLNGNKTLISACLMLLINSDYAAASIPNADLYMLLQDLFALFFVGGAIHKYSKAKKQSKTTE